MRWWTAATILVVVLACLAFVTEGKKKRGRGRGNSGKGGDVSSTRADESEESKKNCMMYIWHLGRRHDKIVFTVGQNIPGQQKLDKIDQCYGITCLPKNPKKKKSKLHFQQTDALPGPNQCDVCKDGPIEYPIGTVKSCKSALPAPCYCDVCDYPNDISFPSKPPIFQRKGCACNCPLPLTSTSS